MEENNGSILLTEAGLLELLSNIDELKQYNIGISDSIDGNIILEIGDSHYQINTEQATDIPVPEEVTDQIEEVNDEAYDGLESSEDVDFEVSEDEPVEGGLMKQLFRDVALAGLVRMGGSLVGLKTR